MKQYKLTHRQGFHKIPKLLCIAGVAAAEMTLGIAPAPAATRLDFGDAPSSYSTLLVNNGPRHTIVANGPMLGANIDSEKDAQPVTNASGDDLIGSPDDEDSIPALPNISVTSSGVSTAVNVSNRSGSPATLACWIDFNKNGVFGNSDGEKATVPVPTGSSNVSKPLLFKGFAQPLSSGNTYMRCRIATDEKWILTPAHLPTPTGPAGNGEVEDYLISIASETSNGFPDADWGDAPNPDTCIDFGCIPATSRGDYQTTADDGGPNHLIVYGPSTIHLGAVAPDADGGNLTDLSAIDDDIFTATDDEDGIAPTDISALTATELTTSVKVKTTNNSAGPAVLGCWIDFNRDGDFTDDGEKAAAIVNPASGSVDYTLNFTGYATPEAGQTYIRCRITSDWYVSGDDVLSKTNAVSVGFPASNGEVEDYAANAYAPCKLAQPLTSTSALGLTPPNDLFAGLQFTVDALATGSNISNLVSLNCLKTDNFAINDMAFIPAASSGPANTSPDSSYSWTFPATPENTLQVTAWMSKSAGATLACSFTDSSGNGCAIPSIIEQAVQINSKQATVEILDAGKPLSSGFQYVKIENGPLGITELEFIVNGAKFNLDKLKNNGTYFLDIGTALRSDVDNKVTLTVKGKADSTVIVLISDEPQQ